MSVFNEYSKLKAVMVGKCYPSNITKKIWKNNTSDKIIESLCKINDETNEDLDNLQLYLEKEGIKVYRPDIDKVWEIYDFYKERVVPVQPGACRDWLFAYGDLILIGQNSFNGRMFEHMFWEECLSDLAETYNKLIFSVPLFSTMDLENVKSNFIDNYEFYNSEMIEQSTEYVSKNSPWKEIGNCILHKDNSKERMRDIHLYRFSKFKKKFLVHGANYFKLDDTILGSPVQSSINGFNWFEKTIKRFYPKTKFIYQNTFGHIDGDCGILDKDLYMSGWNKPLLNDLGMTRIPFDDWEDPDLHPFDTQTKNAVKESANFNKLFSIHNFEKFAEYIYNLRGYDQRVDFDMNSLAIEPRKIIAGIFDKEKVNFLESKGVEVINLPIRHRWVIDGGIHCYTNDVERA